MAHQGLFRAGIASLFPVIALDVVAALGLYQVFRPVSKPISAAAAAMRIEDLAGRHLLVGTDGLGRGQAAAATEHRQPGEQAAFVLEQKSWLQSTTARSVCWRGKAVRAPR